jgi:hypothetical protein
MTTSVCTGLNPFNFIRNHFLQLYALLQAQYLSLAATRAMILMYSAA